LRTEQFRLEVSIAAGFAGMSLTVAEPHIVIAATQGRTIRRMATRTIHLPESSYALLTAEARRRGLDPDELADELVHSDLAAPSEQDLEATLGRLAELRAKLPEIDGIVLAGDARAQLERRGNGRASSSTPIR
jgi:hypothetical protein